MLAQSGAVEFFGELSARTLLWSLFFIFLFASLWIMTKRRWAFYTTAGLVLVLVALIVAERLIVTDREQLRANLRLMADAVRQNDPETLKTFVSGKRGDVKQRIDAEMRSAQFRDCRIVGERLVEIDRSGPRPVAHFQISVFASVDAVVRHNFVGSGTGNASLTFEKENDGQWRLTGYELTGARR